MLQNVRYALLDGISPGAVQRKRFVIQYNFPARLKTQYASLTYQIKKLPCLNY